MTLSLSMESILDQIYALTALRAVADTERQRPRLLTRDHRRALEKAVKDVAAEVALRLASVGGISGQLNTLEEGPSALMTLEYTPLADVGPGWDGLAVVRALEGAVASLVLAMVYDGVDAGIAKADRTRGEELLDRAEVMMAMPMAVSVPRLDPCLF